MERTENRFSLIRPSEMKDTNVFRLIGEGWMLITAEHGGTVNTMTASWGSLGVLWGVPVATFYVRPQRFTYSLLEKSRRLSLSFLPEKFRDAMLVCGSASGRNTNKFKAASLTCLHYGSVPYVGESDNVLICKKLYSDSIRSGMFCSCEPMRHYKGDDYHKVYVCEVEKILTRKQ